MNEFTLVQDLEFTGSRDTFVVPAGFKTDLASIPWPLSYLLPPTGPWARAAILHDWLYRTKPMVKYSIDRDGVHRMPESRIRKQNNGGQYEIYLVAPLTRADADGLMKLYMKRSGVSWLKRNIIYAGVRLGGKWAWDRG